MNSDHKIYCHNCKYFHRRSSVEASLHVTLEKGEANYIQNYVTEKSICYIPIAHEVVNYNWYAEKAKPNEIVMRYKTGTCSAKNRNNDCKDYAERGDKDANL